MKTAVIFCITAILCVGMVLGYIEYTRQSTASAESVAKAKAKAEIAKGSFESSRRMLDVDLDFYLTLKNEKSFSFSTGISDSSGVKEIQKIRADEKAQSVVDQRKTVARQLDDLMKSYIDAETARREYEALIGTPESPLTQAMTDKYRSSLLDSVPHLREAVGE